MISKYELADVGRIFCFLGIVTNFILPIRETTPYPELAMVSMFGYFIGFWIFYDIMWENR